MNNYKNLLSLSLLFFCLQTNAFTFKGLVNKFFDHTMVRFFGNEPANEFYQQKSHEFLKQFGIRRPEKVTIRALQLSESLQKTPWRLQHGFAWISGIWFNQALLDNNTEEERIWHVAHICANYALHHPIKIIAIQEALNAMATLDTICAVGFGIYTLKQLSQFEWFKKWQKLYTLGISTIFGYLGGRMLLSDSNALHTCQVRYKKKIEQETDIATAAMLCNHGYCHVVESHIETLKQFIEKGFMVLNGMDQPSFDEQVAYLEDFMQTWNSYKTITNEFWQVTIDQ